MLKLHKDLPEAKTPHERGCGKPGAETLRTRPAQRRRECVHLGNEGVYKWM